MKRLKRVIVLSALLAVMTFPASAFASDYSGSYERSDKGWLSSIASFFSFGGSDNKDKDEERYNYDKYSGDKKNSKRSFWDWDWLNEDNWWDDYCWWKDHKDDSWKLWEKYYCY